MQDVSKADRQKQVPDEIERLSGATETLDSVITNVEDSLSKILKDPESPDKKSENTISPAVVPLADSIRNIRYGVQIQTNRLQNLLARLEL